MLLELAKGVALLLALSQLYSYCARGLRDFPVLSQTVSGLLFGGICVVGMSMPLYVAPGVLFDARSVVLCVASLFGGFWVGTLAAVIAAAYRWQIGGAGVYVGLGVIVCCYGLGLIYHVLHRRGLLGLAWWQLLLFGVAVQGSTIYMFSLLPEGVAQPVLQAVAWPILLVFSPATLLMGLILKDVHARVATEQALGSQEERLRATIRAIPDLLYVIDEHGTFIEVMSDAALLRGRGHELPGRRLHDVLPPQDAGPLLEHLQRTLALQDTQTFEFTLHTRRGLLRFEARAHALRPVPGHARALVLLARDITARCEADAALQASETRFRSLLQSVGAVAVQGYLSDGTITYWNKASERLYGFSAEEAVGRSLFTLIVPHTLRAALQQQLQDMQADPQTLVPQEFILMHKNGQEVPVLSSHAAVLAHGTVAEFFRFDIDLTERRRNEMELRVAATAFEAQEGMMVTNARREILRINQAFTRISGYADHEVVGHTPAMFRSGWHDDAFYAEMNEQLARKGHWEGEIWNRNKSGEIAPQFMQISSVSDDDGRLTHYVATMIDVTQRKADEDQIRQLAFYDPLTGLPNRRLLMDRLQHALAASARSGACGALLFIDLDHFKTLNDTLGHDKGDLLLQQVAHRLMDAVREEDTVARLGGDEYVVMLEGLDQQREAAATRATQVGEKIIAALNMPYRLAGHEYHSTPSMGLTLFSGHEAALDELLKQADLAMYQAKNAGRNGLRFYDPLMQAAVSQRAELEADIRQGLLFGQFLLHYQPQVDDAGWVQGAEALLRWQHPERGMVSPAAFIPVAEETGQIVMLGSWVLETACSQLVAWARSPATAHLTLAVNVSSRQFRQQDFAEHMLALLDYTGANPHRLKLELTESLLVDNVEDVIAKMTALRARGVGFSLDDFGTGYSSLSYLKRLPLDQLKIDQSFVRDVLTDPNDAAIARTIVALGHSLGLSVIAEGVETAEQRDCLLGSGCRAYQGYFFSRPLPEPAFAAYLLACQADREPA